MNNNTDSSTIQNTDAVITQEPKLIVGICDDIMEECQKAKKVLNANGLTEDNSEIHLLSPNDLQYDLDEQNFPYHIIIMDIEFLNSEFDGIQLAGRINQYDENCQIIYLTHILNFAPQVYETEHCYFVMKNNMETMLPLAMKKAVSILQKRRNSPIISFISNSQKTYLMQNEITYIEKEQHIIKIHTVDKSYSVYSTMTAFAKQLNHDMIRIHNSYMVNLSYIADLKAGAVELKNGTLLPIGRTFQTEVKRAYMYYWSNMI